MGFEFILDGEEFAVLIGYLPPTPYRCTFALYSTRNQRFSEQLKVLRRWPHSRNLSQNRVKQVRPLRLHLLLRVDHMGWVGDNR